MLPLKRLLTFAEKDVENLLAVGVKMMALKYDPRKEVIGMRKKNIYFLAALVATGLLISLEVAKPTPAKEETVTLSISGMT